MAKYTLIDVMRGIRKHGLIDKMSAESFTFLIGLILEANELGFKNPVGFTVNQTLPIGGGNSRQTLNNRRRTLSKFRIDDSPIVTIIAGNHAQNSVATYDIDYGLLCSLNDSWSDRNDKPSNEIDGARNGYEPAPTTAMNRPPVGPLDGSRTILRSEEKRGDQKNTPVDNNITGTLQGIADRATRGGGFLSKEDEEKEKARDSSKETGYLQELIAKAFYPQLTGDPPSAGCRSAIDEYGFDVMEAAAIEARGKTLDKPTGSAAINYVIGIVKRGQSGLSYEQRSKIAGKLKELKTDLMYAEKETDLTKFEGVFIGGQIVNSKQEFCEAAQSEIERLKRN